VAFFWGNTTDDASDERCGYCSGQGPERKAPVACLLVRFCNAVVYGTPIFNETQHQNHTAGLKKPKQH